MRSTRPVEEIEESAAPRLARFQRCHTTKQRSGQNTMLRMDADWLCKIPEYKTTTNVLLHSIDQSICFPEPFKTVRVSQYSDSGPGHEKPRT